jgi:hypothetical protein
MIGPTIEASGDSNRIRPQQIQAATGVPEVDHWNMLLRKGQYGEFALGQSGFGQHTLFVAGGAYAIPKAQGQAIHDSVRSHALSNNRPLVVQRDSSNARGPAVVPPKARWTANQLSNAGRQMDPADSSGRLTKAGRAAQKHEQRPADTLFPEQTGRADQMNKNGQAILDQIVNHPNAT